MGFIEFSIETDTDIINELKSMITRFYNKPQEDINAQLLRLFEELKPGLYYCTEYPYVDWVYRDTFYSYFSSKHNAYSRDCIRVSIFARRITPEHFRNRKLLGDLHEAFKGYIVIRPTFPSILGRTVIHPSAFRNHDFRICHSESHALINGVKLKVTGFPFSAQDTEAISCAETTVWAIMEYFGHRYPDYQPARPSRILSVLNSHSTKRLLPSSGLTVDQISIALKEYGFGTQIYARENAFGDDIYNIIAIYVESGIPIIAAVENDLLAHAILLIGHQNDTDSDFTSVNKKELQYSDGAVRYFDYSDIQRRFIVNDDNLFPYRSIMLSNPSEHYESDDWRDCRITSVVVPLHKKIYLEALDAKELALRVLTDEKFGYKFGNNFAFRFFLTSSRSFKDHVSAIPGFKHDIKDILINSSMPKFIWCAEIYTSHNFLKGLASGLVIIDATEADDVWMDSVIFAGYSDRCFAKMGPDFALIPYKFFGYKKFINNLQ